MSEIVGKKYIGVVAISLLAGCSDPRVEIHPDGFRAGTEYIRVEPGSKVFVKIKDLEKLKDEGINVTVYCSTFGSEGGKIDTSNVLKIEQKLAGYGFSVDVPTPSKEYSGNYGYGYFVVCGKDGILTNSGIKTSEESFVQPEYIQRVVLQTLPNIELDNLKFFQVK